MRGQWHRTGRKHLSMVENEPQFKYLEMTVKIQYLILDEIKRILKSGDVCYHSVLNLLSSRLMSKNMLEYTRL
jgi:hypothetical protein